MRAIEEFDCSRAGRWVIKVGSSLITDVRSGINTERIESWAAQVAELKRAGVEPVIVSSGSIVEGMKRLGWEKRPQEVHLLQAAASVGQMGLIRHYETAFEKLGFQTAQVLLTNADLSNRSRYLNARNTLRTLLELDVVPIVNENDTIVTDEIRLGDNDTLAALVTNFVDADILVILTDQAGLHERDPRTDPDAKLVRVADSLDESLRDMAGPGTAFGRGGMHTKVEAARRAARSGSATVIGSGFDDSLLGGIRANDFTGTLLVPRQGKMAARKQWLAGQQGQLGKVILDDGAVMALTERGRSLLPIGVKRIEGKFSRGDVVSCLDLSEREVAKGLINYDSKESSRIKGERSDRIKELLGYASEPELIHRDNMVVVK